MLDTDHDYFRRRERQERIHADRAKNFEVRRVHEQLANAYANRTAEKYEDATGDLI